MSKSPHDLARMAKIRHAPCYDASSLRDISVMVGTLLIAINHGHAIIAGQITQERIFQMFLTVIVPYIVSTASSVATRHENEPSISGRWRKSPIHRRHRERELVAVGEKCDGNTFGKTAFARPSTRRLAR